MVVETPPPQFCTWHSRPTQDVDSALTSANPMVTSSKEPSTLPPPSTPPSGSNPDFVPHPHAKRTGTLSREIAIAVRMPIDESLRLRSARCHELSPTSANQHAGEQHRRPGRRTGVLPR